MKKIISLVITAALLFTSATASFAGTGNAGNGKHNGQAQNENIKAKKATFKINGSPVIKYGSYKLPISPVTRGMGATLTFDKNTGVLTVTKGTITIVINFKARTVTVNGVADTKSGLFTATNSKKMTVLIKYIANALGIRVNVGGDQVDVEVPALELPTNVTITPAGGTIVANTLNLSTLYLTAAANITAGQAAGGKAELYVGSKLVATDDTITATDTKVTFTTSDETPTNAELRTDVPEGGVVTVKLFNAENKSVTSAVANPTLVVDYEAPTLTGVTSAVYNPSENRLFLVVTGAGATGDKVDVTMISMTDSELAETYLFTNASGTGSTGTVTSANSLTINVGSLDKLGLTDFGAGNSTVTLTISVGSLLTDAAGNTSAPMAAIQNVPVTIIN